MKHGATFIRWFEEIKIEDIPLVGEKYGIYFQMKTTFYTNFNCQL